MEEIPKTQKPEAMREKAVTLVNSLLIENDIDVGAITDRGWLRYRGVGKATLPYIKEYIKALGLYEEEKPELDVLVSITIKNTTDGKEYRTVEDKTYTKGSPLPCRGDSIVIGIEELNAYCVCIVTLREFTYNDDGDLSTVHINAVC